MRRRAIASVARVAIVALAVVPLALGACAPSRGAGFERAIDEARSAYHDGRFDVAADRFTTAATQAKIPRDAVYARYEAALARARAGDVARGATELRAIANEKPPSEYAPDAAFRAAELAAASDPAAGYADFETMLVRFPENGLARVALGKILRDDDEHGKDKTLAHLEALAPTLANTTLAEDIAYQRARRLADLGKREAARDAFVDVAARWPYPKGAYFDDSLFRASELEESLGRRDLAIADLERLLSFRESSVTIGSYERPRYSPAILRIAQLYEDAGDRSKARETLHRLYRDFKTSPLRDDALWREAELWAKDGDQSSACDRLATLAGDFPDSRYVPCAIDRCPSIKRPSKSKAPATCHPYLTRAAAKTDE